MKFPRLTDKVSNDFKILIDFLDRFEPEVSGRSLPQPYNSEDAAKLLRFANGRCEEDERTEVCEMLRMHRARFTVVPTHPNRLLQAINFFSMAIEADFTVPTGCVQNLQAQFKPSR